MGVSIAYRVAVLIKRVLVVLQKTLEIVFVRSLSMSTD